MDLVSRPNTVLGLIGVHNLSGCSLAIFWPDGVCIELSPIGVRPRAGA
jgi:hypothetical protein